MLTGAVAVVAAPPSAHCARWLRALALDGWRTKAVEGLEEALSECRQAPLAMLLVGMEAASASGAASRLAEAQKHAIVIVCAPRDAAEFVIGALESWADDHFPLDIEPELLRAKARAHLRRHIPAASRKAAELTSPDGRLRLDVAARRVDVAQEGGWRPLTPLTPSETTILRLLLAAAGLPVPRRDIVESLWESGRKAGNPAVADKHVESLRRKLGKSFGARVKTVYGVGYLWQSDR